MLGLSLGPVTGRLVAELAGGARPSIDLAPLAGALELTAGALSQAGSDPGHSRGCAWESSLR